MLCAYNADSARPGAPRDFAVAGRRAERLLPMGCRRRGPYAARVMRP